MIQTILQVIKLIVLMIGIAVIGVLIHLTILRFDRYMDILAVSDCNKNYSQELVDSETGITVIRPLEQQARECAQKQGVKNWDGVWSDLLQ